MSKRRKKGEIEGSRGDGRGGRRADERKKEQ